MDDSSSSATTHPGLLRATLAEKIVRRCGGSFGSTEIKDLSFMNYLRNLTDALVDIADATALARFST